MKERALIESGEVQRLLRKWLDPHLTFESDVKARHATLDFLTVFDGVKLIIEVKRSDALSVLDAAVRHLAVAREHLDDPIAIVATPYMGTKARQFLEENGISWMDLSGNADIRGRGIRVLIEGRPDRFTTPGRPSTVFSPKASRLTRAMLVEPERWWMQNELAATTGLSNGYVSKTIRRMDEDALITRHSDGRVRPASPDLLLDTWAQAHDFRRNDIRRYHAVGRTGAAVLHTVAEKFTTLDGIQWAATGLAAAWEFNQFADFRLASFYVSRPILRPEAIGLRSVSQGENVWIVTPKDEGVFYAPTDANGISCVHPIQCYLDLLGHPERAKDAAAYLRKTSLPWSTQ